MRFRTAVACLFVLFSPLSAMAQSLSLHGTVSATAAATLQQSFTNQTTATLSGLTAHDVTGNDGIANGSLASLDGRFSLKSHACSGGGPGFGGQASAGSGAAVVLDYVLTSATLPAGTPASITVRWALRSRVTAVGTDMVGANTSALALAGAHITVSPNYNIAVNVSGSVSRSTSQAGDQVIRSGSLQVESDSAHYVMPMLVGQVVRISVSADLGANSSVEAGQDDADTQLAVLWGVTSNTAGASTVLLSNPAIPSPPAASAVPESAAALLPPRPVGLMPCFKFSTQPANVALCGPGNASFTAVPQGSGPFTYRWRRNGVPMNIDQVLSANTNTLSLSGVSPADSGTYDCVVTSPCGDIVSNSAKLTVCVLAVDDGPLAGRTRLAAPHPAPFRASTTLGFDLATAGVARLDVYDLRGARVRTLVNGWRPAGRTDVLWRGDDDAGRRVPAGMYLVRLASRGFVATQKVVATQ